MMHTTDYLKEFVDTGAFLCNIVWDNEISNGGWEWIIRIYGNTDNVVMWEPNESTSEKNFRGSVKILGEMSR
jgi:hypothetical protein